jgi:hypothetical protein
VPQAHNTNTEKPPIIRHDSSFFQSTISQVFQERKNKLFPGPHTFKVHTTHDARHKRASFGVFWGTQSLSLCSHRNGRKKNPAPVSPAIDLPAACSPSTTPALNCACVRVQGTAGLRVGFAVPYKIHQTSSGPGPFQIRSKPLLHMPLRDKYAKNAEPICPVYMHGCKERGYATYIDLFPLTQHYLIYRPNRKFWTFENPHRSTKQVKRWGRP